MVSSVYCDISAILSHNAIVYYWFHVFSYNFAGSAGQKCAYCGKSLCLER